MRTEANTVQTARQAVIVYITEITTNIWTPKELPHSKPISRSQGISGTMKKKQEYDSTLLPGLHAELGMCTVTPTAP